ncbi:concanavalin A-like lectin/glucanase domain-containing protein [Lactarius hengduanensis]|nr:concanavalin A-like lectin/glucanase domain-containing protein [Lactarius hengduanensis]
MLSSTAFLALALALPAVIRAAEYGLVKEYAGKNFFDEWDFYGHYDNLTNGAANFLTASDASKQQLAFVNAAGNAIMKVDNKTDNLQFNQARNSVRIATKDYFTVGSVWITDMLHVPYGCSVWPAFWSQGPGWPNGGEIDTFEAVNLVANSQVAVHTQPGCTVVNATQTSTLVNTTDCSYQVNSNSGCSTGVPDPRSFGAAFAAAGGGVFVTEFATTGISVWFFSRSDVPSSLQDNSSSIDTAAFGVPVVNIPPTGCEIERFFQAQNLIFDITLCGAGNPTTFYETCSGFCVNDYVLGPPSTYDNAYFESAAVDIQAPFSGARRGSTGVLGLAGLAAILVLFIAL